MEGGREIPTDWEPPHSGFLQHSPSPPPKGFRGAGTRLPWPASLLLTASPPVPAPSLASSGNPEARRTAAGGSGVQRQALHEGFKCLPQHAQRLLLLLLPVFLSGFYCWAVPETQPLPPTGTVTRKASLAKCCPPAPGSLVRTAETPRQSPGTGLPSGPSVFCGAPKIPGHGTAGATVQSHRLHSAQGSPRGTFPALGQQPLWKPAVGLLQARRASLSGLQAGPAAPQPGSGFRAPPRGRGRERAGPILGAFFVSSLELDRSCAPACQVPVSKQASLHMFRCQCFRAEPRSSEKVPKLNADGS